MLDFKGLTGFKPADHGHFGGGGRETEAGFGQQDDRRAPTVIGMGADCTLDPRIDGQKPAYLARRGDA